MADHVQSSARLKDQVHIYRREDGLFDWRLKDAEGRELCSSMQGYENSQDALDMAWDLFPYIESSNFFMADHVPPGQPIRPPSTPAAVRNQEA